MCVVSLHQTKGEWVSNTRVFFLWCAKSTNRKATNDGSIHYTHTQTHQTLMRSNRELLPHVQCTHVLFSLFLWRIQHENWRWNFFQTKNCWWILCLLGRNTHTKTIVEKPQSMCSRHGARCRWFTSIYFKMAHKNEAHELKWMVHMVWWFSILCISIPPNVYKHIECWYMSMRSKCWFCKTWTVFKHIECISECDYRYYW